jgi:hypothetical protein
VADFVRQRASRRSTDHEPNGVGDEDASHPEPVYRLLRDRNEIRDTGTCFEALRDASI